MAVMEEQAAEHAPGPSRQQRLSSRGNGRRLLRPQASVARSTVASMSRPSAGFHGI